MRQINTLTTEEIRERINYLDRSEGDVEGGLADMASTLQEFCIEPFASLENPMRSSLEGEAFYKHIIYPLTFAIDKKLIHPDSNLAEIAMYNAAYWQSAQNAIAFLARVNSEQVMHLIKEAQKYANENHDTQHESCMTLLSNLEIECRKFIKKEVEIPARTPVSQSSGISLPSGQKIQNITGKATEFRVRALGTASDDEMSDYCTLFCSSITRRDGIDAPGEAFYKEFIKPVAMARITLGDTMDQDAQFKKYAEAAVSCLARIMASEDDPVSFYIEKARIYCNEHPEDRNPLCEKVMLDIEDQARKLKIKQAQKNKVMGTAITAEQPTQKPPAAQSVATKDEPRTHFDEIFNEIKKGKKEVTFDEAITLEDLNAFIMRIQAANLKLDMLTARNITFSGNNKVSLPSPNVASYWVESGSDKPISNLEGSTARTIKVLNKKTVAPAELNALLFGDESTSTRPSIAPAPKTHFAGPVILNNQDITAQLPQSNLTSAGGGIRFGRKVTINAKRVIIDGQEFPQQAATAQPQHQPAQQQAQVTQSTQSAHDTQKNIAASSSDDLQKSAVKTFLQNPSIAKSAYWKDKTAATVTVQEILDHVDGKHKGMFFSYSGKDTKTVLEGHGVNFTDLVGLTDDKKINYLCEKINSAPHAIPTPANK